MKLGLSTYSLVNHIKSGSMSVIDVIKFAADIGAEHVEIVPFGFSLVDNDALIEEIRVTAEQVGIELSNYAVLADLLNDTEEEREQEIQRMMEAVDIAHKLGLKVMRHDVSAFRRPFERNTIIHFEQELPLMVEGCRRIADYAAQYGITTTLENHGFYVNGSDRVIRLIHEVNRPNFKLTLDTGNYWCVDEDPVVGVKKTIEYAAMVHLKDFYFRKSSQSAVEGNMFRCDSGTWFKTYTGNILRGSIFGEGDIDTWEIMRVLKHSGYDGYISLEFEGMEDGKDGSRIGLENARRLWEAV